MPTARRMDHLAVLRGLHQLTAQEELVRLLPVGKRGYHKLFLDTVTQADKGVDFEFLRAEKTVGSVPTST